MINLYVDDLRECPKGFVIARTVNEAKDYLQNNQVSIISLDHDLGEDSLGRLLPTGYDLVKYICEKGIKVEKIFLHTDNPVGRDNMYFTLIGARARGFIDKTIEVYPYPVVKNVYSGRNDPS